MKYKNIILVLFLLILISSCQKQVKTGSEKFIKVAVFKGFGASPKCISDAVESLKIDSAITPIIITADNILNNGLKNIDVLLFAGGSGSKQMSNMGNLVVKKVQDFVYYEGRGVVGICAGAYLLSDTPDYTCMHLCPAEAIDREHDERGHGLVKFSLTEEGKKIFPELSKYETAFMQYYEGPVLIPATKKYAQFTKLAVMLSDVHLENDAPADMTNNKPFLLNNKSGKGKVFLTVGHPENTPGMRWIVPRMARWAAGKELISYSPLVVKPERDSAEVLFDENLRKKESELYSNLIFGNSKEKLKAINQLVEIRSWGAKERITGLLRDKDPEVRLTAARAIVELEHTAAIKDLQSIYLWEKDLKYKNELKKFYKQLAGMCYTLDD